MNLVAVMLFAATFAQVGSPATATVPPKIAKFLEQCENSRRGAILQIEHKLRGLRRENPGTEGRQTGNREIAELERQLKFLESTPLPTMPTLSFPPQLGAIGRLPGLACHVDQIVSGQEMLVRCFFQVPVVTVRNYKGQREIVEETVQCLIRGAQTGNASEGSDFETDGLYEVVAHETYQTASGTARKILVLRSFDKKALDPYLPKTEPK
jgi:hypothetical protein